MIVKFADTIIDLAQPDGVGIPHWPSTPGGITVAIEVDDIDIDSPKGNALKN